MKPNDRPISVVSKEVRLEMNGKFGINMSPGDFNEQIEVEGMGDLGAVAIGAQLQFDSGVGLEVVDYAWPCAKLARHNGVRTKDLVNALNIEGEGGERYSRRGLLAKVIEVGNLAPGNAVTIVGG